MSFNEKVINDDKHFRSWIAFLKEKSPLYPQSAIFYQKEFGKLTGYRTTLLRLLREGKWYKVHVVVAGVQEREDLLQRLHEKVYEMIVAYNLCGHEELDRNQQTEKERLMLIF